MGTASRRLQRDLWHAISATNLYNCTLQLATSFSMFESESILLASGIMAKQGNTYAFKKNRLDELKDALKENLTLHITHSKKQKAKNAQQRTQSAKPRNG